MKQLLFMIAATAVGTIGVFTVSPFCGVAVYYLFAVLRPQSIWAWSLPPDVAWSFYVAIAAILGGIAQAVGFMSPEAGDATTAGGAAPRRFTWAHICLLLFGVWVMLSYFTAIDPSASYTWVIEYLKIFVMFIVSTMMIRTVRQVWVLFVVAALSIAYVAYEVNFVYLFQGHYLGIYHNGYGGLDNNGAGLMFAMGVPLCAAVWEGSNRIWRWAFAAVIPVLLHAVLLTYSRGAMVSLILASPLIFLRSRHRITVGLVGLCLILSLPLLAGNEIQRRFFSVEQYDEDASAQSRFASWNAGWNMAKDHPIFGVGLRNSNLFSQDYGADVAGRTIHSQYLQIAADNGLVGIGLYLTALASIWWSARRTRRATRRVDDATARKAYAIAAGTEGAMAVFCIGAIFLSLEVFELPYLMLLLAAQLRAIVVPSVPAPQPVRWPGTPAPQPLHTLQTVSAAGGSHAASR
jgi:probable O-glycosylation ligase (exosortase A-associated)